MAARGAGPAPAGVPPELWAGWVEEYGVEQAEGMARWLTEPMTAEDLREHAVDVAEALDWERWPNRRIERLDQRPHHRV